ncbi:MAG: MotA/TolQ/ExbB proton channel family protein [Pirellulales bacterium]
MSERRKLSSIFGDPSLLLAVPTILGYYALIETPPLRDTLLHHYTTEHTIEYVIVGLFLWGLVDIVLKTLKFPKELSALRRDVLPPRTGRVPIEHAAELLSDVQAQGPKYLESRTGQRLVHVLSFVIENKSAEELPVQTRYLAEQDHEATYNRYSLVGFVVAITPILGFLGTVVHFATALGGMTLENLDNQLTQVVSEMGTAFQTTTVALGASMITMFCKFLCERTERGIDGRIDRLVERELLNRFEVRSAEMLPLIDVLRNANAEFHNALRDTLGAQVESWTQALEGLFEQFDKRQKIEEARWQAICADLQDKQRGHESLHVEQLRQILAVADERQDQHLHKIHMIFDQATTFGGEIGNLAKTLNTIAKGEGRLGDLQLKLVDNLKLLHETNHLDEAVHGLTAAIHLMTTRQTGHAKAA